MKNFGIVSVCLIALFSCAKQRLSIATVDTVPIKPDTVRSLLALGDSYTIGQSVLQIERFPAQTIEKLKALNVVFSQAEYIATTGWTTRNLINAINSNLPTRTNYDFVTLLIGVNNQYQGRSQQEYATEFTFLLNRAILYAGSKANRVAVLSIPDWSVTPFANGQNTALIARQIDSFNLINKQISLQMNVHYLDITLSTRMAIVDPTLIANDGLHPSGKEYTKWATMLSDTIKRSL